MSKLELDLFRGKIVHIGTTTSFDLGDIKNVDGAWYYHHWRDMTLSPQTLREIADLLDDANVTRLKATPVTEPITNPVA